MLILIISAVDIEMNPGPRSQCRLCKKYCKASEISVKCERCEKRFHTSCIKLDEKELLELESGNSRLFQQSIDSGDIPKEWTLANISPLFKKGDRSLACNYRPVSLTCVTCKLLEHIVCSNITAHLDEHKLLSDKQHAFRKWPSCETQLATVINDWAKILDNKGQVDTFILDFEKALTHPT